MNRDLLMGLAILALLVVAPAVIYPVFLMELLCFALFAAAFNLLIGYVGLLSFGYALFFGWASYVSAHAARRLSAGRHRKPDACACIRHQRAAHDHAHLRLRRRACRLRRRDGGTDL